MNLNEWYYEAFINDKIEHDINALMEDQNDGRPGKKETNSIHSIRIVSHCKKTSERVMGHNVQKPSGNNRI